MNVLDSFLLCAICLTGITQLPQTHQINSPLENLLEKPCQTPPNGTGIPGFPPGTPKSAIRQMFGIPTRTNSGYWPKTTAIAYDLIPNKVSLGFLFDTDTQILKQTEASFADNVELKIIQLTLNSMLGCQISDPIKQGLFQIRQRQTNRFYFFQDTLKGIIERHENQRIYIGIWQEDLH